ncbi:hypothetical protein [Nocardia sp. CNY236]|uniref:hypothetical protein n=1 Tax=Nocardia sp. CNY236 TaxID=1169152 RepID=UPI000490572A|nr:hypothetical protein [Nocardia sp. CNY236]
MFAGHPVDPPDEFQRRSGEHAPDPVLEGANVVAGQEVAGADRLAPAAAGAFDELGFLGQRDVSDGILGGVDDRVGLPDPCIANRVTFGKHLTIDNDPSIDMGDLMNLGDRAHPTISDDDGELLSDHSLSVGLPHSPARLPCFLFGHTREVADILSSQRVVYNW